MSNLWIKVEFDGTPKYTCDDKECELNYPCSTSFSCKPYKITIERGFYLIDVFGAEGGGVITPGKGGEMKGIINIKSRKVFYAFVGAKGVSGHQSYVKGTFGGGGSGYGYMNTHYIASGGGASDLRYYEDSLSSRIIVAGGGGGSGQNKGDPTTENTSPGGDGSGEDGKDATGQSGTPGSGAFIDKNGVKGSKGSFGFGGNLTESEGNDGSGGGGGYYGGNAGMNFCSGGGGGSGFINKRLFYLKQSFTGVRKGNGLIKITKLTSNHLLCSACGRKRNIKISPIVVLLLISN